MEYSVRFPEGREPTFATLVTHLGFTMVQIRASQCVDHLRDPDRVSDCGWRLIGSLAATEVTVDGGLDNLDEPWFSLRLKDETGQQFASVGYGAGELARELDTPVDGLGITQAKSLLVTKIKNCPLRSSDERAVKSGYEVVRAIGNVVMGEVSAFNGLWLRYKVC